MWSSSLHFLDLLLWTVMAVSVAYVMFFSLASLLPRRKSRLSSASADSHRFLVLFPAYKEDAVITTSVETFLKQDYPGSHYHVAVVSDHMQPATNSRLRSLPVTLLTPDFEKSSKAKALQYAIAEVSQPFDRVVILDADNIVRPDFLTSLNAVCRQGFHAIQCHRTAKNSDNDIAALDGISEEINNSIFRKGHNRIGLSSALIGSGMCFDYDWFKANVDKLDTAVEDRELEALLLKQRIYIHYAENIFVMDEKVSSSDNFQRQRLRWMTGQVQALLSMAPYLPKAIASCNINYIDKTVQQALIPRSILLASTFSLSLLVTAVHFMAPVQAAVLRWWLLFVLLCVSLFIAMPPALRKSSVLIHLCQLPLMTWRMCKNLLHINTKNKDFLHTTHRISGK